MDLELPTPSQFPAFPYDPPYSIQVDLMRHLYTSIEQRAVTIVESPTGTGKTLTLLCSALTWLSDEKERARKGKMKAVAGDTEEALNAKDWVIQQTLDRVRRDLEAEEEAYEARLAEARKREEALRRMAKARVVKRQKQDAKKVEDSDDEDDDRFLPESDQPVSSKDGEMHISPALRALMAKVDGLARNNPSEEEQETTCTKIYYASRTHSQLAQVLPELRRLKLDRVSIVDHHDTSSHTPHKRSLDEFLESEPSSRHRRTVALGSRKQLCINDDLKRKATDLDEACRERLGETGDKRCQYLPPPGDEYRMLDFRDEILATPKDIEDLAETGRISHICPYFGSRKAIPQAELVTLPYNLLLQKSAREALGIQLKDQIVIIDEAHNLIPTLLSLSTTRLTYSTLETSFIQVCIYVSKFRNRLSPMNMLHLKRLVVFLDALKKYVALWKELMLKEGGKNKVEVMTVADLTERLGKKAAAINLLEVETYLKNSKVARKIASYSAKQTGKEADPLARTTIRKGAIPPLHIVEEFMISLTNTNEDGRVTFTLIGVPGKNDIEMKYQLLNPSPNFMEVVEEARAVVLAGGTMSPISDVINQLFSTVPSERITNFSCGHIIPEANLQTLVVCKGPRGGELDFKADKQTDPSVIAELGQIILNFLNIIPAGTIVFFPSYNFLNHAKSVWLKSGILGKFEAKKKVFFEPEDSTTVETVLHEYAATVQASLSVTPRKGGALLFAVIGAKLSEGLNFADDLARSVIIVGLPFANLGSPELRERMKYVKRLEEKRGGAREKGKKDAAAELYENMCMNAVNQSIGRAIRHKDDWASLVLLDRRYSTPSIRNKLPRWIGNKLTVAETFGQTMKEMSSFFRGRS